MPFFTGLTDSALSALADAMRLERVPPRHILFQEGDPVTTLFWIVRGSVRLSVMQDDGKEGTINLVGDGEFLPHAGLILGGTYPTGAMAMVETEVASIGREAMVALVRREPEIALNLLMEMGWRAENLQLRVRELAQRDLRVRVLHVLMRLARVRQVSEVSSRHPDEVELKVYLTHEELARLVGGTRESVSRILSGLRREGVILHANHGRVGVQISRLEAALARARNRSGLGARKTGERSAGMQPPGLMPAYF